MDILTCILEYVRPKVNGRKWYFAEEQLNRKIFLELRLVNKNFDGAIQKLRSFWIDMLSMFGPKMIGPSSKHYHPGCTRNPCRIAAHYDRSELIPRYDQSTQGGAYKMMIKVMHKKTLNKKKAELTRKRKATEKIEIKLMYAKAELDMKESEVEDLIKRKKK